VEDRIADHDTQRHQDTEVILSKLFLGASVPRCVETSLAVMNSQFAVMNGVPCAWPS